MPIFIKACKDDIPNVQFCVARVLNDKRAYIDGNVFSNQITGPLKDMTNSTDKDVVHFAQIALQVA